MSQYHSPRVRPTSAALRRPSTMLMLLFAMALVVGGATARSVIVAPRPVLAACHSANLNCFGGTKTAAASVYYYDPDGINVIPVEPTGTTSWSILVVWSPTGPGCTDYTETATVDIAWNGSGWTLSNLNTTSNILDVDVCDLLACSGTGVHGYGYKLIADINDPVTGTSLNLNTVTFTATSIPNGDELDIVQCDTTGSTTPTASSFNGTDSGSFECAYNCDASGTTVNITYN